MNFQIGSLITFTYHGERVHDSFPRVLVLHPGWRKGNTTVMHALNFNYLTADEINTIRMLIDPGFKLKYYENMHKKNPNALAEFDRIITQASNANITSPQDFYHRVIRPFIQPRGWDPYRLYNVSKIVSPRILQTQRQMLGEVKSAFFGTQPQKDLGKNEKEILADLALLKAREEKMGVKQLSPQDEKFLRKLNSKSKALFQQYKTKFQYAKGPAISQQRGMTMPRTQGRRNSLINPGAKTATQDIQQPKFMDDSDDFDF